jgi:hypothetical protein
MASETITLTNICAGGGHLTFSLTGAKTTTVRLTFDEATEPLTEADAEVFCRVMLKLVKIGRNNNQTRAAFEAGVTVSV